MKFVKLMNIQLCQPEEKKICPRHHHHAMHIALYMRCKVLHAGDFILSLPQAKEIGESRGVTKQEGGVTTCATQKLITKYRNLFSRFRGQSSALKRFRE